MRWFGENWGAPFCTSKNQAPTPDVLCAGDCGHDIRHGDIGVLIPYLGPIDGKDIASGLPENQLVMVNCQPHVAYHLVCFFDNIGVRGVTHK